MSEAQDYVIVIPARFDSQRLPGKVLLEAGGKTMLQHVWERARESKAAEVIVATDDQRIMDACRAFGAVAVMTANSHVSGSDRIAEAARIQGWAETRVIVNLQGDEPHMPAACLDQVATLAHQFPEADAATLYCPVEDPSQANDPNVVKVVTDGEGRALLFSRSAIPYYRQERAAKRQGWKRHIGLYAYRTGSLCRFAGLPQSPLEIAESLEQLRYLENGGKIVLEQACLPVPAGIDTADDFKRFRQSL